MLRKFPLISGLRRDEAGGALRMLASLLLVITSFWILKPLRKALFVSHYDAAGLSLAGLQLPAAQAELCAKLLQVLLASLCALAFGRVARAERRRALVAVIAAGFAASFFAFALCARQPSTPFVWLLYSAGDLYSTLMLAALFACLNDLSTPESARRCYGLVGLGAVVGGVIGSQVVSVLIDRLPLQAWLCVCGVLTLLAAWLALSARAPQHASEPLPELASRRPRRNTPLTPYVVSLALLVGLYEVISTLLDYQFTATLARSLDGAAIGRQMGRAFALMNATALFVQLFVTAPVLRRYGARGALLCLPISLTCASLGMLVFPVLPMASLLPALDSGFAYSVHQSAKEGMYVPLESDAKYRAKAFVDVLVLRGAKALGIVLSLGAAALVGDAAGMRWLSLLTLALVVPFGLCALRAGRRSEHVGHAPVEPASASPVATRRPVLP